MLGRRLMSLPLRPADTRIESVLSSVAGSFDSVRWYDPQDATNPWKSYIPSKPSNSLRRLDETMGFWINFTRPCTLTVTGYPIATPGQYLHRGWNLVGFPSDVTSYTVGDLMTDIGVAGINVEAFDQSAPPYYLQRPPLSYALKPWEGYWIYAPQDCIWLIGS